MSMGDEGWEGGIEKLVSSVNEEKVEAKSG